MANQAEQPATTRAALKHSNGHERQAMAGTIEQHDGQQIVLPRGMSTQQAIAALEANQAENHTQYARAFEYRPYDGAHATQAVMLREYNCPGFGMDVENLFGTDPPERISIKTGVKTSTEVPWGAVLFPPLDAVLHFGRVRTAENGIVFRLIVQGPKAREAKINAFFEQIEAELHAHSIYRGRAIDAAEDPSFLDLSGIDPDQVIYNADTQRKLEANLWTPLAHADVLRELGLPIKRSVLLEGTFGTGKTLAAFVTAMKCGEYGWTFIYCRPGDNLREAMATARLYTPAMVFYEDIDRLSDPDDPRAMTVLLDIFDGMQSKAAEVVAIATTNHRDRIHKGMLRPGGRLDAVITIEPCDRLGAERLMRAVVDDGLLAGVDVPAVAEVMAGMTPAFARETCERAVRYAVAREQGRPRTLDTEDFLAAAGELRDQEALMAQAKDDTPPQGLEPVLRETIYRAAERALDETVGRDSSGEQVFTLTVDND